MRVGGVSHWGGRRYLEGWEAVATFDFLPPNCPNRLHQRDLIEPSLSRAYLCTQKSKIVFRVRQSMLNIAWKEWY
jgi:hypothetical protein